MTYMFEVYYLPPVDPVREDRLTRRAAEFGGRLDFREDPGRNVCLTYEFDVLAAAEAAAEAFRGLGEYVEGPQRYS